MAAVDPEDFYKFVELAQLTGPTNEQVDDSITQPTQTGLWTATSIDVSAGRWGFIRLVGLSDEFIRFDLDLLRGKTVSVNGEIGVAAERIEFNFGTEKIYAGLTDANLLTLSSSAPEDLWASEVHMRAH